MRHISFSPPQAMRWQRLYCDSEVSV